MVDDLGNRMKAYEAVSKRHLIQRMPVIVRIDGKSFSKYTSPLKDRSDIDPFNVDLHTLMTETMEHLCRTIQNVVLGYTQSDEISLLLKDWTQLNTQQAFGAVQSKIETVLTSLATGYFNHRKIELRHTTSLFKITQPFATFDGRSFNIPREDVTNYFIWRQQDASRNSVSMLGRHHFSHKMLHGVSTGNIQDMLMKQHKVNWNDLETWKKRGTCWVKDKGIDNDIPIFTQNRNYIESLLHETHDKS